MYKDKARKGEYNREYRQKNKERCKEYRKEYYQKNKKHEKEYCKKYGEKYRQENKERNKERNKEWREKNKEYDKERHRENNVKHRYNLSLEQVDKILIQQDHRCLICKKSLLETKRGIDHDHNTGKTRGILCLRCNMGLSFIENTEFNKAATEYLQNFVNMRSGM